MIKYLGSKRRLVPVLTALAERSGARTALDAFTGTTRVAQALRGAGLRVTALDRARYSEVLARCYVATDPAVTASAELREALDELGALPGEPGYVTETFCEQARFFHPDNGARIDAIRAAIARDHAGSPLEPLLLTSLLEAADRVDSTTGVQMAYLKAWAPRALRPLELRVPVVPAGPIGEAVRGDALDVLGELDAVDLAYLDPPYNHHSYMGNYHVWETLTAWDAPEHYGVAHKRVECRDPAARSAFNSRPAFRDALAAVVAGVRAGVVLLSYNDESWIALDDLLELVLNARGGTVAALAFEQNRYVGARIGIHDQRGRRVGKVGRLRNVEYIVVSGPAADVERIADRQGLPLAA
jgi:adenine-specific DNA-methyltransferase